MKTLCALLLILLLPIQVCALTAEEAKILLDSQKRLVEQLDSSFSEQCKKLTWTDWGQFFKMKDRAVDTLDKLNTMYLILQQYEGKR
jgi:hypothetical protein